MPEQNWLNPMNKIKFQAAFRRKAPQVTLLNGQKFKLDYTDTQVKVHPIPTPDFPSQFIPMGTFELRKVKDALWLAE